MSTSDHNTKILDEFLRNLALIFGLKNQIAIDATNFNIVDVNKLSENNLVGWPQDVVKKLKDSKKKYSLLFESFPFSPRSISWESSSKQTYRIPENYMWILESLSSLENDGFLLAILPQSILFSQQAKKFEDILKSMGYSFSAVFNLPEHFFGSLTSIRPLLLVIRKQQNIKLFISEIHKLSNFETLLKNYRDGLSKSINEGLFVKRSNFSSFENYRITQQIGILQSHYKNYREYRLQDIANTVNATTQQFEESVNTIYIPKLGTSLPVIDIRKATLKHQNYFQVSLREDIVSNEYLVLFFKSNMGSLILGSLKKVSIIPHVNKSDLLEIRIPVPDFETQNLIVKTSAKIKDLGEKINDFESQLSLNPDSALEIQSILNNILQSLGKLNDEDQIMELIRQGESKRVEFKQTFSRDIDTGMKEKEKSIRESSLKNIVAFLNSEGGTLLIGVNDNGEITGLEEDNYENDDKYLLNFKNHIKDHIGEDAYPFLDWKIIKIDGLKILKVECVASTAQPFFLNESDFYVRTNPSADKLIGPRLASYLKERFKM